MTPTRPCPVCRLYRLRPGEELDPGGHHPACGVSDARCAEARKDKETPKCDHGVSFAEHCRDCTREMGGHRHPGKVRKA